MNDRAPSSTPLSDFVDLARPKQWAKNVFVLLPLVFSENFSDPTRLQWSLTGFAVFCLVSSGVYAVNDVLDRKADAAHPRKRRRPVASGRVAAIWAIAFAGVLWTAGAALSLLLPRSFLAFVAAYVANSLLYCVLLKHRVIADVLSIAFGFVIRILAGCAAISVEPSSWIIICGFALSLLLGFGKRRLEVDVESSREYRSSLVSYDAQKLNVVLAISATLCLVTYMLYAASEHTIELHGAETSRLLLLTTTPLVTYGVFRYVFKVQESRHDGPDEVLLSDPAFWICGVTWLLLVVGLFRYS